MRSEHLLLLTSCIDPSTGPGKLDVYRSDPKTRLRDYEDALRFWLSVDDPRLSTILFVENSGYPLDSLCDIARLENPLGKQVEFQYVGSNVYPSNLHYGYAELGMIDAAIEQSPLARTMYYFVKANGRLTFPDLPRLLDLLPPVYLFAVDARSRYTWRGISHSYITTQLMLFSIDFYSQHVIGRRDELTGTTGHIEEFFYNALLPFRGRPGAMLRWPINVPTIGEAAHWPKSYHGRKQRVMNAVRGALRRLAPELWF